MNRKKKFRIITFASFSILILCGSCVFMWRFPKPSIKSAEFQFELKYELNGETIVVEDILVCKYKGIGWDASVGKHRTYDKYIKSNKRTKDIMLCKLENGLILYYYTGYPAFYMGDVKTKTSEEFNHVYSVKKEDSISTTKLYNNKSYEEYGIKLISWTIDAPIENSFE